MGSVRVAILNNLASMRDNLPRKDTNKPIATIDFETDPFLNGRIPRPFVVCFYSETMQRTFWGDDCAEQLISFLDSIKTKYLIYAHNGGKYDYHFLHPWLEGPLLVIKNRIAKSYICGHEFRDSYSIIPVRLQDIGAKLGIAMSKMERHCREKHREEIIKYCMTDCIVLHEAVSNFIERFGRRLTIGSVAIDELRKLHPHNKMNSRYDAIFRPWYLGGRVQCFKGGSLPGPWKLLDVNSMYPYVMAHYNHPINGYYRRETVLPNDFDTPFFVRFTGKNKNALPCRNDEGHLIFNKPYGEFMATNHELKVALEYDLITIEEIHDIRVFLEFTTFDKFVELYAAEKEDGKRRNDKQTTVFAKTIMNASYGKEGSNPANFMDWIVHRDYGNEPELRDQGYTRRGSFEGDDWPKVCQDLELWAKPAEIRERSFHDVAIAASITSAARAVLLEGLQAAEEPVYCDTDSIICRGFNGTIDPYQLGAWDLEAEADNLLIGGKKLYALYNDKISDNNVIKLSSKGGTLTLDDISRICNGEDVVYYPDAPTFSLHGRKPFIPKTFRATWADAGSELLEPELD